MQTGSGSFMVWGLDFDGSLSDDVTDPVTLVVESNSGSGRSLQTAQLQPYPHPMLTACVFAHAGPCDIGGGAVVAGLVRGNGALQTDGLITVDVLHGGRFETVAGSSVSAVLQPYTTYVYRAEPDVRGLFDWYAAQATLLDNKALAGGGNLELERAILSPTRLRYNKKDATANSRGIYLISAGGKSLKVRRTFLRGTLLIDNPSSVDFTESFSLNIGPNFWPTILVRCGSSVTTYVRPTLGVLDETTDNLDYNEDGDKLDMIPTFIGGLCQTTGRVEVSTSTAFSLRGLLTAREVRVRAPVTLDNEPLFSGRLIPGFLGPGLKVVAGGWQMMGP
jgi:hypothetical protein